LKVKSGCDGFYLLFSAKIGKAEEMHRRMVERKRRSAPTFSPHMG